MRRILLAILTFGLAFGGSAIVAPAAEAASSNVMHGGCFYDTDENDLVTGGQNVGVIGDLSVTTDSTGAPTDATVTCWVEVNYVEAPHTRFSYSGFGVQAGTDRISFTAEPWDLVRECQSVAYVDGTSEPATCDPPVFIQLPPTICEGCSILEIVFDALNNVFITYVDPVVCPVLVSLAGTYPGGVTIAPDGDVFVPDPLGLQPNPVYDCPPYVT
jgi:hypothetical protein